MYARLYNQAVLASVTRLRIRSVRYMPEFLLRTLLTQRETIRAAGFIGGHLLVNPGRIFWTLTVWETEQAMKAFRGSGAHARVMPKLRLWCDEASYAHWSIASGGVPAWSEAYEHLVAEGRLSPVTYPSEEHTARRFHAPNTQSRLRQQLKPALGSKN